MGQLTNQYVSSSYQGLLKMTDSTQGVTGTLQTVQTGDGTNTPLQISQTEINISGSLTVNGAPISFDTGSFATTGSNIFTGKQTITGSNGRLIYDGTTNATPNNALAEVHADNDSPWLERFYNDSYSTSGSVMSYFGWNDGRFIFHNDSTSSIAISVDGYYNDNLVVGDTNTTSNNDLIVSGAIKTNGAIQWSNNAFNYSDNVSGALYFSTLNNGTLHLNDDGGEGDVFIGWGPNNTHIRGNTDITGSLGVTNIKGTGSLLLQPNQSDARYLEVYNTSPTDTHITGSGGQIYIGDDKTYVKVDNYGSTKRIDIVADNGIYVSGSAQITGSIDITGQYLVNGVPFTGGSSGTSGTSGQDGSSGTSGSNGTDGSSGTSGSSGQSGSSGTSGQNGLSGTSGTSGGTGSNGTSGTSGSSGTSPIFDSGSYATTGSNTFKGNQVISGSLIGTTTNNGMIKIFSEAFVSGTIQLNITGSNQQTQSNIVMGWGASLSNGFAPPSNFTGSIILSGSNNILMQGIKAPGGATGFKDGYVNGSYNIMVGTVPVISTSSLAPVIINSNLSFGTTQFDITTGSGNYNYSNNYNQAIVLMRHKSGSFSVSNNSILGNITSFATQSFIDSALNYTPTYTANFFQGTTTTLLNISSSISAQRNIINSSTTRIENRFTNPTSYTVNGSGSLTFNNNVLIGNTHTILSSGSAATDRTIANNLVAGYGHNLNQISSGSDNTNLTNTAILGQGLIVSGSNTSTTTTGGSTFVGRFNATGSLQESTNDAVFVVGTGTAANARRNAIHVDSNNNTRITGSLLISGSINITGDVQFASGSNKTMGTVALDGGNPGTATVSNSLVTANSLIFLTKQTLTNAHSIAVSSKGSSTFTITSTGNGDSDTVAYQIINPA